MTDRPFYGNDKSSYDMERELNERIESQGKIHHKDLISSIVAIAVKRAQESGKECE